MRQISPATSKMLFGQHLRNFHHDPSGSGPIRIASSTGGKFASSMLGKFPLEVDIVIRCWNRPLSASGNNTPMGLRPVLGTAGWIGAGTTSFRKRPAIQRHAPRHVANLDEGFHHIRHFSIQPAGYALIRQCSRRVEARATSSRSAVESGGGIA
jgi:hypothetical protein